MEDRDEDEGGVPLEDGDKPVKKSYAVRTRKNKNK